MTRLAPLAIVAPPTAAPSLHGLAVSAQAVPETDERWVGGFTFDPETGVLVSAFDPTCENNTNALSAALELADGDCVTYYPICYELGAKRSARGFLAQDYAARPRAQLEAGFPKRLEQEFWTGALNTDNQHLAVSGCEVLYAGAVSPARALGLLENALAGVGSGGRGMIHASPELVTAWTFYVHEEGGRLVTNTKGTIVVAGAGYPGTGPLGHADAAVTADTQWAFASGLVHLRSTEIAVSPEAFSEALDRDENTVTYRAFRYAATTFDPHAGPFAVRVTLAAS